MSSEQNLATLLADLAVHQHDGVWEFVTGSVEALSSAVMTFREREGWTHIVPASSRTPDAQRFVWLELTVYSDLNAIGFLAAVSSALARAGVPCNAVAAFHHDHVFVPEAKVEAALDALAGLKQGSI